MIRLRHNDESPQNIDNINVTPFIDVMLVLLVIFMVTAPLTTVTIPVDLPSSSEKTVTPPEPPVSLTLKADHHILLNETEVTDTTLTASLNIVTQGRREKRIILRADKTIDYGMLIHVIDQLRQAGYFKINLLTLQTL